MNSSALLPPPDLCFTSPWPLSSSCIFSIIIIPIQRYLHTCKLTSFFWYAFTYAHQHTMCHTIMPAHLSTNLKSGAVESPWMYWCLLADRTPLGLVSTKHYSGVGRCYAVGGLRAWHTMVSVDGWVQYDLGGSGGMLPQENNYVSLDPFWCVLRAH